MVEELCQHMSDEGIAGPGVERIMQFYDARTREAAE